MPKLDSDEIKKLKIAIEYFIKDIKNINSGNLEDWERTLWRRYFIVAKLQGLSKFKYVPGFFRDIILQKTSMIGLRRNS